MHQSPQSRIGVELVQFVLRDPSLPRRFVVVRRHRTERREDEVPHVEVKVLGLAGWPDRVDVEVDCRAEHRQTLDPALLGRLPPRRASEVRLTVRVPARLEPSTQLAVLEQQHPLSPGLHDECRRRQMTRTAGSQQRVVRRLNDGDDMLKDALQQEGKEIGITVNAAGTGILLQLGEVHHEAGRPVDRATNRQPDEEGVPVQPGTGVARGDAGEASRRGERELAAGVAEGLHRRLVL